MEFREKGTGIGRSGLGSGQMELDGIQRGERTLEGKGHRREEGRKNDSIGLVVILNIC